MGRNRTTVLLLIMFVCALGISGMTFSQTHSPAEPGIAIKVAVNSVLLNVAVRDRNSNRSLAGLQQSDFQVYEDGVLQEVQDLRTTNAPYSLMLLMDVSGSTRAYMKLMKKAATEFTHEIGENDRIAIAWFNSRVRLAQDFTSDLGAAQKAIAHLHSGGGTAFYDALTACVDEYMHSVEGRKAIVVFTDGVDNVLQGNPDEGSRVSFEDLYKRLQETDTIIYTIFLNSRNEVIMPYGGPQNGPAGSRRPRIAFPLPFPPASSRISFPWPIPSSPSNRRDSSDQDAYQIAQAQLKSIAELTGGRTYSPRKAEELSGVYTEIADDLRIRYLLSYASSNTAQDRSWRSIRVLIHDHPEAVVRTRTGYSVRPPASAKLN